MSQTQTLDELLDEVACLWARTRAEYRDGALRVGEGLHRYVLGRLEAGDGLAENARLAVGASREKAVADAAARLGVSGARVNELVRAAEAARLLGPAGGLSYSCVRLLRKLVWRPGKVGRKGRRKAGMKPSEQERWAVKPGWEEKGPALVARAAAEGWNEARLKREIAGRSTSKPRAATTAAPDDPVFTTGKVSKLLKVAPRTVSKWCDSGALKHYKVPCSQDRRVLGSDLVAFLVARYIPVPRELVRTPLASYGTARKLGEHAATAFELGELAAKRQVGRAVVGDAFGAADAFAAAAFLLDRGVLNVTVVLSEGAGQVAHALDPRLTVLQLPQDLEVIRAIA